MSYASHFNLLLDAFFRAAPGYTPRQISLMAGLGPNWISEFRKGRAGTFGKADRVVGIIHAHCPQGAGGDEVRQLLAAVEAGPEKPDSQEDAA